ncbi:MAG: DinB family protein, partial [Deltaproteobacteria bacterium]|nr:DinB family protein [Deltaproteobacteria bacterium]
MNWKALIAAVFENMSMVWERVLDGLNEEELNHQSAPDSNSIGWLAWHSARGQDRAVAGLTGEEQIWIKEQWYTRFNRPPDPTDFGLGHTPEDLAAFKSPDVDTLLGYQRAVFGEAKRCLENLSESDLDRKLDHPVFPTVGARIIALISDNLQHAGQAGYVR